MDSVWDMSDEKVRQLLEYIKTAYGEYLKSALLAQATIIIFHSYLAYGFYGYYIGFEKLIERSQSEK